MNIKRNTVLTTTGYSISVDAHREPYIIINGENKELSSVIGLFDLKSDRIVEYNANDCTGFAIYDRSRKSLTIVNVNSELDGSVEIVCEYGIGKYGASDLPFNIKYNNVTEVFTIVGKEFKLKDLKEYKEPVEKVYVKPKTWYNVIRNKI